MFLVTFICEGCQNLDTYKGIIFTIVSPLVSRQVSTYVHSTRSWTGPCSWFKPCDKFNFSCMWCWISSVWVCKMDHPERMAELQRLQMPRLYFLWTTVGCHLSRLLWRHFLTLWSQWSEQGFWVCHMHSSNPDGCRDCLFWQAHLLLCTTVWCYLSGVEGIWRGTEMLRVLLHLVNLGCIHMGMPGKSWLIQWCCSVKEAFVLRTWYL